VRSVPSTEPSQLRSPGPQVPPMRTCTSSCAARARPAATRGFSLAKNAGKFPPCCTTKVRLEATSRSRPASSDSRRYDWIAGCVTLRSNDIFAPKGIRSPGCSDATCPTAKGTGWKPCLGLLETSTSAPCPLAPIANALRTEGSRALPDPNGEFSANVGAVHPLRNPHPKSSTGWPASESACQLGSLVDRNVCHASGVGS